MPVVLKSKVAKVNVQPTKRSGEDGNADLKTYDDVEHYALHRQPFEHARCQDLHARIMHLVYVLPHPNGLTVLVLSYSWLRPLASLFLACGEGYGRCI